MTSRNQFRAAPSASFSKKQVSRAGDFLRLLSARGPLWDLREDERDELVGQAVEALTILHWWRDQHARPLKAASQGLRYHVGRVTGEQAQVSQRLKRIPTILDKLGRIEKMNLARMWDIGGVRARLPGVHEVYAVAGRIERWWEVRGEPHDYIAEPKPDGYRAYHLYVEKQGRVIEVQLRTELQDTWANQVERDGRLGDRGYKFGRGDATVLDYYQVAAEVFAARDWGTVISPELRERFQQSYDASHRAVGPNERGAQ